jgi:hypothetical protein
LVTGATVGGDSVGTGFTGGRVGIGARVNVGSGANVNAGGGANVNVGIGSKLMLGGGATGATGAGPEDWRGGRVGKTPEIGGNEYATVGMAAERSVGMGVGALVLEAVVRALAAPAEAL